MKRTERESFPGKTDPLGKGREWALVGEVWVWDMGLRWVGRRLIGNIKESER